MPETRRPKNTGNGIPSVLRRTAINFGGMSYSEECERYGVWRLRALRGTTAYGKIINEGDIFEMPGNHAASMAANGIVEFIEIDLKAEKKAEEEAAAEAKVRARDLPAFNRTREKSWMNRGEAA